MKRRESLFAALSQNSDPVDDCINASQLLHPRGGLEVHREIRLDDPRAARRCTRAYTNSANDDVTMALELSGDMTANETGGACQQYTHAQIPIATPWGAVPHGFIRSTLRARVLQRRTPDSA